MAFLSSIANRRSWLLIVGLSCIINYSQATQNIPVDFAEYHSYAETVEYVKKVADSYPKITELLEIGRSGEGRPIHVLVISNMTNGATLDAHVKLRNMRKEGVKNVTPLKSYQGKPGHWICGAIHGSQPIGAEVCLYIIDKLVSGYGSDDGITHLVDHTTFYICPVMNPDGLVNSITKGVAQKHNIEKKDNDNDGKINEDGPDDLNKDGYITEFRYPDEKGHYVIDDEDPRFMVKLKKDEKTEKQRYSVVVEDMDNDGDGKRGEDPVSGIDLNRNYPEEWYKKNSIAGGSGAYPTSAPETRAVVEFFTNHRNILMAQFYQAPGGFTFRPLGTASHKSLNSRDVAVFDLIMGKQYLEIIGEDIPEAWQEPESIKELKKKLKETSKNKYAQERGYELPRGWRVSYDEAKDARDGYGLAIDWAYKQYGIYAIASQLWNPEKDLEGISLFEGDEAEHRRERELLRKQDSLYEGKLFISWEVYEHPQLGPGEIGGWIPLYPDNPFPGKPLINVCEKHWRFERFRAELLPQIVISNAKAKVLYTTDNAHEATAVHEGNKVKIRKGEATGKYQIVEVSVKIENKGKLATHIEKGETLSCLREDVVWLVGDREKITFLQGTPFQRLGVLDGAMKIPGFKKRGGGGPSQESFRRGFRRGRSSPEVFRQLKPRRQAPPKDEKKSGS